jgi:poly-beta-hydroxyalkanoate depolymerase
LKQQKDYLGKKNINKGEINKMNSNDYEALGFSLVLVFVLIAGLYAMLWIGTVLSLTIEDGIWISTWICGIVGVVLIVIGRRKR